MAASARILAIDDQPYFRRFLQGLLSEEGYDVVLGRAEELGRRLGEQAPFDLVLLDSGGEAEMLRAIARVRATSPTTPIIALSAAIEARTAIAVMKSGACDFLLKPVDRDHLLTAIKHALPRRGGEQPRPAHPLDSQQLVDENLRFMGRLSLLERVLPLLASLDVSAVAAGFLELLCVGVAAATGELWLRRDPGLPLERLAEWGGAENTSAEPSEAIVRAMEAGRAETALADSEESLLLPLLFGRRMLGIVRVSGGPRSPFGNRELEACAELADLTAMALHNALRFRDLDGDRLRDSQTRLPSRGFFDAVLEVEIHKAHRFGRRLCIICVELHELQAERSREVVEQAVHALARTLRNTDFLCSDGPSRLWVLVTDTDPLGGVVLKRRLADRLREAIASSGRRSDVVLGVSSYPLDGETREALVGAACARAGFEQQSVIHELGFQEDAPLAAIGERLLRLATRMPEGALGEIAEFLIGELTCRPHDTGLLFLAPGNDPTPVVGPLMGLGDAETGMEVFLATDGDTVPACPSLTAVALPPSFDTSTTWIVRFGEGPPYALVAGAAESDGTRPIYHSSDPVLVEQMTFRLCAELGVGVRN